MKKELTGDEGKYSSIGMEAGTKRKFKKFCKGSGKNMSWVVSRLLEKHMDEQGVPKGF